MPFSVKNFNTSSSAALRDGKNNLSFTALNEGKLLTLLFLQNILRCCPEKNILRFYKLQLNDKSCNN